MIRRTFALAGAVALALGTVGLAGPAAADDTGIAPQQQIEAVLSEVGVDMVNASDPDGQPISGTFVELRNTTNSLVELDGWLLEGCSSSTSLGTLVSFGPDDEINPNASAFFLLANDDYADSVGGDQQDLRDASLDSLDQIAGGLELTDDSTTALTDSVQWGTNVPNACSSFDTAADIPTNTKSIDRSTPTMWDLADPTPNSQLGDKP